MRDLLLADCHFLFEILKERQFTEAACTTVQCEAVDHVPCHRLGISVPLPRQEKGWR